MSHTHATTQHDHSEGRGAERPFIIIGARPKSLADEKNKTQLFEKLAREFSELDTVEEIVNWNLYLQQELNNDTDLVNRYNAWSGNYFRSESRVDDIIWAGPENFKKWLGYNSWILHNGFRSRLIDSTMQYGRRLSNRGLFSMGPYQAFWLAVRLNPWAISLPETPVRLDHDHEFLITSGVLGMRYKPISNGSLCETRFIFPLGDIIYAESVRGATPLDFDIIEWIKTPYILAVGIQSNGRTEIGGNPAKEPVFYFIRNPAFASKVGHIEVDDSDDDTQNSNLCRDPPPCSVARVKSSAKFLTLDWMWMEPWEAELGLKPLSDSKHVPEMTKIVTFDQSSHIMRAIF